MRGWLLGAVLCLSLPTSAAERIVSLAPFLTDMVLLFEAEARLVGVLDDQSLPGELDGVQRVGAHQSLSLERIVTLRPDLVLGWTSGNSPELLTRLESLGIAVRRFDPQTLQAIDRMTLALGDLLGERERAQALSTAYRVQLSSSLRSSPGEGPDVFVQLWREPIFTVAGEQLLSDVLRHCGARNVFASLPGLAPQISVEAVLAAQPDVILALAEERSQAAGWLERWSAYPQLPAVRHDRLYALHSDALVRPTPAIARGVAELCGLLAAGRAHPAADQKR
ncbi:iron complex transport system substrate-binding protein/vitamin B12 transport system substrate-binding protein [Halopseudomonas xinjiangensis]|uniref:Iron complex transport system substrate-binding protein/vitamin B12 transport system substrate-binding protein n=1 Tax=Halopseudomonas xinjiangensis TaxID=487184 RepID=A0A1H1WKP2_9GAMM|nr:cobalamin-binding protein [Halopseudomonas xinjiangensis]SDS97572.1 iron complex transport system substrate-binding protein/vitamin B12 transport system substrate-binding protein [Halopseudomonas xinjiangensis]